MPIVLKTAYFRFYGDLNDFLASIHRQSDLRYTFRGQPAVKDAIEAVGVPHPEVYFLQANGEATGFDYQLDDGDRVSVYPRLRHTRPEVGLLRPDPPAAPRFALDAHLGQLARYLRMLGFDTRYRNDLEDDELARIAHEDERVLLTRDLELLKWNLITYGTFVRATDPEAQLKETLDRFDLHDALDPLTRCLDCNARIQPVEKEKVLDQLPPRTREHFDEFYQCTRCKQVYWKGSHYERMQRFIDRVTS